MLVPLTIDPSASASSTLLTPWQRYRQWPLRPSEVVVVSVGPAKAEETLRTALAMGADRAILVETDDQVEPLAVAKIVKRVRQDQVEWENKFIMSFALVSDGGRLLNNSDRYSVAHRRIPSYSLWRRAIPAPVSTQISEPSFPNTLAIALIPCPSGTGPTDVT